MMGREAMKIANMEVTVLLESLSVGDNEKFDISNGVSKLTISQVIQRLMAATDQLTNVLTQIFINIDDMLMRAQHSSSLPGG